jgi:hypothetical protein
MNHIIHNISIILIFFGIILLTYNLTKSYNKCTIITQQKQDTNQNTVNQDRPSKVFNKMFNSPDVWMGYADFDTKNFKSKLI